MVVKTCLRILVNRYRQLIIAAKALLPSSYCHVKNTLLVFLFALNALGSQQDNGTFTFDDFKALSQLPSVFWELNRSEQLTWINERLKKEKSPVKRYQLNREKVIQIAFSFPQYWQEAAQICQHYPPFERDYILRTRCLTVQKIKYADYVEALQNMIIMAKEEKNFEHAARLLSSVAWQQSENGDMDAAFGNYEEALRVAGKKYPPLTHAIMFNMATLYTNHGNEDYVLKGLELLRKLREEAKENMAKVTTDRGKESQKSRVDISYFNAGYAYLTRLKEPETALKHFQHVVNSDNKLGLGALSLSALAAAELGNIDQAKDFLKRVPNTGPSDSNVAVYFSCYRQITRQFWDADASLSDCFDISEATTLPVKIDIYKRLSKLDNTTVKMYAHEKLGKLFLEKLEPLIYSHGQKVASRSEMARLESESELKSKILQQQELLQVQISEKHRNRQNYFISLFLVLSVFFIVVLKQLSLNKKLASKFKILSNIDALTKLNNRRYLDQHIDQEIAKVNGLVDLGSNARLGILIFDIDHFKSINDTYGHDSGDEILFEISQRVKGVTRESDLLVRWGGEEFVYIARLDEMTQAMDIADRILAVIGATPFSLTAHRKEIPVSCTMGLVEYPFLVDGRPATWERLLRLADMALYHGKENGRNCSVFLERVGTLSSESLEALLSQPLEQSLESRVIKVTVHRPAKKEKESSDLSG